MANEAVFHIRPRDLCRLNGPIDDFDAAYSNDHAGVRLAKGDTRGYTYIGTIPANLTMGTGMTFSFVTSDDGKLAADLGKAVVLGITVKKLASGSDTLEIATSAGTEQTLTITNDSTSGEVVLSTKAIANANLDSAGVGDTVLIRIRRLGANSSDTAFGPLLLHDVYVFNT